MSTQAPGLWSEQIQREGQAAPGETWRQGMLMFFAGDYWRSLFDDAMNKAPPDVSSGYTLEQLDRESSSAAAEITEHFRRHFIEAVYDELDRRGLNPRVIDGLEDIVSEAMDVLMFRIVYGTRGVAVDTFSDRPRDMEIIDAAFAALQREPEYWMPEDRLGGMPLDSFCSTMLSVFRRPVHYLAHALPLLDMDDLRGSLERLQAFAGSLGQHLELQRRRDLQFGETSGDRRDLPFLTLPRLNQFVFAVALTLAGLMIALIVAGNLGSTGTAPTEQQQPPPPASTSDTSTIGGNSGSGAEPTTGGAPATGTDGTGGTPVDGAGGTGATPTAGAGGTAQNPPEQRTRAIPPTRAIPTTRDLKVAPVRKFRPDPKLEPEKK